MKRSRDHGCNDPGAVADCLAAHAAKSKAFIKYYDDSTYDKLPGVKKELLMPYKPVLESLGFPSAVLCWSFKGTSFWEKT